MTRRTPNISGAHNTPRRKIASKYWMAWDDLANECNMAGSTLVSRLIHEILTDTERAVETCKMLKSKLNEARNEKSEAP